MAPFQQHAKGTSHDIPCLEMVMQWVGMSGYYSVWDGQVAAEVVGKLAGRRLGVGATTHAFIFPPQQTQHTSASTYNCAISRAYAILIKLVAAYCLFNKDNLLLRHV